MTSLRLDRFTYRLVVHAERREHGAVHAPCGVRECSGGDRKRLDGLVKHMQCDRDPILSTGHDLVRRILRTGARHSLELVKVRVGRDGRRP